MDAKERLQRQLNKALYGGKDGEKIAAEIVSLLAKEKLTVRAAKNVLKTVKQKIDCEVTLDSLL